MPNNFESDTFWVQLLLFTCVYVAADRLSLALFFFWTSGGAAPVWPACRHGDCGVHPRRLTDVAAPPGRHIPKPRELLINLSTRGQISPIHRRLILQFHHAVDRKLCKDFVQVG